MYNEQIHDLLEPKGPLAIREDPEKGVVVQGLSFHQVGIKMGTGSGQRCAYTSSENKCWGTRRGCEDTGVPSAWLLAGSKHDPDLKQAPQSCRMPQPKSPWLLGVGLSQYLRTGCADACPLPLFSQPASAEQLLEMLANGNKNRTQHPTDANATSSRSHAIFQVRARGCGIAWDLC